MKQHYCSRWDLRYSDENEWTENECDCDPGECEFKGRPAKHPVDCPCLKCTKQTIEQTDKTD